MSEPILAPFWGPTWLHFGPQDASKTASLGLQDALSLASYFRCLFGSIFGPSWGPSWPQLGAPKRPRNAPEGPRKASWRHLGPRNRPRPAQTPSGPPQGLILGPPGTVWGPFWNRFGTSWNRFWGCFWYLFGRPLGIFPRLVPPEFLSSSPTQTLPRIQWGLLWPQRTRRNRTNFTTS